MATVRIYKVAELLGTTSQEVTALLKRERPRMKTDLALYAGGEDTFCYRWVVPPAGQRVSFGVLDRRELAAQNVRVVMAEKPDTVAGHAFTTGAIPRTGFEKVLPATRVEIGVRDGAGCDASHFTKEEQDGKIVFDQFYGEHATCFNVKDRGLVVVTSCSHRGIVGICRHAARITGVPKVHAVIGGFHLSGLKEERVTRVVDAFRDLEVDWIVPQHCTGLEAMASMMHRLPQEMVPSSVGSVFTFGK